MILAKDSIGTEDTGEYCEADGNAEKRENILDVGACKVVFDCSLCNFDNDVNLIMKMRIATIVMMIVVSLNAGRMRNYS